MNKYFSLLTGGLFFLCCCGDTSNSAQELKDDLHVSQYFNKDWANNSFWDDSKAEVAVYDAQTVIYKKIRNFEYDFITVSEDLNQEYRVKTDDYKRNDLYKVMKLNAFARIETENYPYNFLTSVFLLRGQPWVLDKMTAGSQEWCGNTFKEYLANPNGFKLNFHSYFDGEGDGEIEIKPALFEDQLAYTLRALKFKEGLIFNADVLETQVGNRVGEMKIHQAKFYITDGKQEIKDKESWKVQLKLDDDKVNTYYFAKAYPNILLKQQTWDGRDLLLKKVSRYAYWKH